MAKFSNEIEFERAMKERNPEAWLIEDIYTDIISMISIRRNDLGWSQAELADKCGLKQSAIARLEMCTNIPRLDTVIKVLIALNLTIKVEERIKEIILLDDVDNWGKETEDYYWQEPKKQRDCLEGLAAASCAVY